MAVAVLISTTKAIKTPDGVPVHNLEFHFNEDPHSSPEPLAGNPYMTATQAKYLRKETWDTDTEDKSLNPLYYPQFNARASEPSQSWMTKYWGKEPLAVQLNDKNEESSDSDSDSDSSDSESDDEHEQQQPAKPQNKQNVQW